MKTNANLYILYFSVPQQKEVAGVWYRDHEGKQFLKIALLADAWSMAATIKTRKGVHRMTMDRWGDSTPTKCQPITTGIIPPTETKDK